MDNEIEKQNGVTNAVKQLAEAASTQIKSANKMWLSIVVISLLVLFPPSSAYSPTSEVELPFKLATVASYKFFPILFGLMSVLIVAFASSYAQALRAHSLTIAAVKKIISTAIGGIYPQDLYDMLTIVSANRVGPLAQLLRGKYQFFDKSHLCPSWLRVVTAIYYFILKSIAWGVYWMLPAYAYFIAYEKAMETDFSHFVIIAAGLIGASSLFVAGITDMKSFFKTFIILFKKPDSEKEIST